MEFDPNFVEKYPYLSGILPKNSCIKSEIPTMAPIQPSSTLSPLLSHSTSFLYQNNSCCFQQHPLYRSNHRSGLLMAGPSSINPFSMIPTPSLGNSYKAAHTNGSIREFSNVSYPMAFTPNNSKIEAMHGYSNNCKIFRDFSPKNLQQNGVISQPRVGHSLSELPIYDAHTSVPVELNLQEELSYIVGVGNNSQNKDPRLIVGDEEQQERIHGKNSEIHHNDSDIIKGQWTMDEDRALVQWVNHFGRKNWCQITKFMNGRTGKQCRDRWNNHLQLDIKKDSWDELEDKILIEAHKVVGNKWTEIAKRLPGRTENTIKNHWYSTKRKQNVKRKHNKNINVSKSLLLNYIREVTVAEEAKKEPKRSMNMLNIANEKDRNIFDQVCVQYEITDGIRSKDWDTQGDGFGDYVPTMFNDVEMKIRSDTMNYEVRRQMLLEDVMKREMDFIDMIYKNP